MNRATRWKAIRIALVLVATVALAPGGEARGDACSECGPPTLAELGSHPDFQLDTRHGSKDYVETDGGECTFKIEGEPTMKKTGSWLILRGTGEVWNCPFGSSEDTMTATTSESDSSGWTLSASAKVSLKSLGTGVETTVTAAVNQSCTIQEVTSISKKLKAAYCHRIPWKAYFEVATYEAQVEYTLSRRFAWWTKNVRTGHVVHRHGEVWIVCETGTATLDAEAPISWRFPPVQGPVPGRGVPGPGDPGGPRPLADARSPGRGGGGGGC